MKHYINKIAWIIFVICVIFQIGTISIICYQKSQLDEIEISMQALKAEFNDKTSWPNVLASFGKAIFDGATFGLFTEGGMFAEADKFDAWRHDVFERANRYNTEREQRVSAYSSACMGRNWSAIVGIIALLTGIFTKSPKQQIQIVSSETVKTFPETIKTFPEIVNNYQKFAEQGDAQAQFNLGTCYANGYGVPQDISEAVKWWRKAAEQGHPEAIKRLQELNQ